MPSSAIAPIAAADCPEITFLDRHVFAGRQIQLHREREGALLWKDGRSRGYRPGDEWAGHL